MFSVTKTDFYLLKQLVLAFTKWHEKTTILVAKRCWLFDVHKCLCEKRLNMYDVCAYCLLKY